MSKEFKQESDVVLEKVRAARDIVLAALSQGNISSDVGFCINEAAKYLTDTFKMEETVCWEKEE